MLGRALVKYLAGMEWLAEMIGRPLHPADDPTERRAFHGGR